MPWFPRTINVKPEPKPELPPTLKAARSQECSCFVKNGQVLIFFSCPPSPFTNGEGGA